MKALRYLLSAAACMAAASTLQAQQLWLSAGAQAGITRDLKATVELEHRSDDNFAATSRWDIDAGLSYRLAPWLRAGADYIFIYDREGNKTTKKGNYIPHYWEQAHRLQAKLTASHKLGAVELSLRETYQFTHSVGQTVPKFDDEGRPKKDEVIPSEDSQVLRSRLEAEYTISKKCRFEPFASVEVHNDLVSRFNLRQTRYTAGSKYKINRHNSISAFYRYIDRSDDKAGGHIFGLNYEFKL